MFELIEGPCRDDIANPLLSPSMVEVSRTALHNFAGHGLVAPITSKGQPPPISASIGSQSMSAYYTPDSRCPVTPSHNQPPSPRLGLTLLGAH